MFDEYIARLFKARSEVAVILSEMKFLRKELSATAGSLPVLKNLTQTYRRALEQGSTDLVSYYRVQNELTAKQLKIIKLRQLLSDMGVALEVAAGEYLPGTKGVSPALPAKAGNGKEPE